jgi:hypothetical protein
MDGCLGQRSAPGAQDLEGSQIEQIVIVQWFIRRGPKAADGFAAYRNPVPEQTEGFLGETLYEAQPDGVERALVYINIGRWRSQQDFYTYFPNARRDQLPPKEKFESRQRRRYWLTPNPS